MYLCKSKLKGHGKMCRIVSNVFYAHLYSVPVVHALYYNPQLNTDALASHIKLEYFSLGREIRNSFF